MNSRDVAWMFGMPYLGILVFSILVIFKGAPAGDSYLMAICLLAGGGVILSLLVFFIGERNKKKEIA